MLCSGEQMLETQEWLSENTSHNRRLFNTVKATKFKISGNARSQPCLHGYTVFTRVKQQKGTAYLWEMTHPWCRENFSCREDTLSLHRLGWVHVLRPTVNPEPVRGGEPLAYGLDSPDGVTAPPAHQSDPPAPQQRQVNPIPMLATFPVEHTQTPSRSKNVIYFAFQPMLKLSQALMHVSHSQCDHICPSQRERESMVQTFNSVALSSSYV